MRRPLPSMPSPRPALALCLLLLAVGMAGRLAFLPARTSDTDNFLTPWLLAAEHMGSGYLHHPFTNYTAFYEHCLALLALFPGPPVLRVKLFSILWDAILAFAVSRLVPPGRRLLAAAVTLALPTIAMNSALLGQSDAIYATMIVACLAAALAGRPVWAMLAFSAAVAVKLQALMAAPLLVLLWLDRRQPWWTFTLVPVAYLLFALPMAVAGRPATEIFGIYRDQFSYFAVLSNNAPNIWQVGQKLMSYEHGLLLGLPAAVAATGVAILLLWRAGTLRARDGMLLAAAILLVLVPFVTPKMHDRYFYPVDPVLVALACRDRRFVAPLLLAEAASILGYLPFIADGYLMHHPVWGRTGSIALATGLSYRTLPLLGTVAMAATLALLVREAWRRRARSGVAIPAWPWSTARAAA